MRIGTAEAFALLLQSGVGIIHLAGQAAVVSRQRSGLLQRAIFTKAPHNGFGVGELSFKFPLDLVCQLPEGIHCRLQSGLVRKNGGEIPCVFCRYFASFCQFHKFRVLLSESSFSLV